MRYMSKAMGLGLLLALASVIGAPHNVMAADRGYDYYKYENDGAGLLDAINRDHGSPPRTSFSGVGTGPTGAAELNPYEPDKWFRNEVGMIDAINRDHGVPTRSPYSGIGHGPTGVIEVNPYDPDKWFRDETGMIDAINQDYPPVYPRSNW